MTKINNIDSLRAWTIINRFNILAPLWIKSIKRKTGQQQFNSLFKKEHLSSHLWNKYAGYLPDGFAGFFLNLDYKNQIIILKSMFGAVEIDFTYPDFADFKDYKPKDYPEEQFDIKTARTIAIIQNKKTKWDLYPHDILFINKFLLYANNNGIDGYGYDETFKEFFKKYKGNKYGNFKNWNKFWTKSPLLICQAIVEKAINY